MPRRRTVSPLLTLPAALVMGIALAPGHAADKLPVLGAASKDQDLETLERGLIREGIGALREFRTRDAMWVIVAPSLEAWTERVAPGLGDALAGSPSELGEFVRGLPEGIRWAGPAMSASRVRIELPEGAGKALVDVQLPDLLRTGPGDATLTGARVANKGHWLAGLSVPPQIGSGPRITSLHVPPRPRPLVRGNPAAPPLLPLPDGGKGRFAVLGAERGGGDKAKELTTTLQQRGVAAELAVEGMVAFPPRSETLPELLRSVRVEREALATPEGDYHTVVQAPEHWTFAERRVRHPTRVLALAAPLVLGVTEGDVETPQAAVVGVVALYTPMGVSLEEAPALLDRPARAFTRAVHEGELPVFRVGDELVFYRPHLDRWARGEATPPSGKERTTAEAAELVGQWSTKKGRRALARAQGQPLPTRMQPIPDKEREGLVDDRRRARPRVFQDDLDAWLRHLDPGLKSRQPTLFALTPAPGAMEVFAELEPRKPARAVAAASYLNQFSARGGSGGGGAETLGGDGDSGRASRSASGTEELRLAIVDLYTTDDVCRMGSSTTAGVAFEVEGPAGGEQTRLKLEWDLLQGGRSIARDAIGLEREPGTHELEFGLECPPSEGSASLYVTVYAAANEDVEAEGELEFEARLPSGRSWPKLSKPSPKPCKAMNMDGGGEDFSLATTAGLTADQIGKAVRSFQEQTLRCYRGGVVVSGSLQLEITVECDGRVTESLVMEDGTTGDPEFAECVAKTWTFAAFPAHDREGGVVFELPLRYE